MAHGRFVICAIYFLKEHLRLNIRQGIGKGAGKKSDGFFAFDGPKRMAEEQVSHLESGEIEHEYRIRLSKSDDLDDVISLLKKKYNSMV